ncbi:IS30 family transposase [Streptomyces sp. NBC_01221]|uniref:IS30 family transposase n=1 Tax=Streptomyces sp. NBC_01221 TaxID=2903782 RepID=UPI00225C09CE|nr:IS30 family transposase [Streptomyces sp. NBC_01221]MCX4791706.1 IS30 family transposase [Streptomyces sp. NBC_01221]
MNSIGGCEHPRGDGSHASWRSQSHAVVGQTAVLRAAAQGPEGGSGRPPSGRRKPRFLTQDDRIAIADGLRAGRSPVVIAAEIGKSVSTVYREIGRGRKENGEYEPWWAHNQALLRRQRPKEEKLRDHGPLRAAVREKLDEKWSPQQIARHLAREHPNNPRMRACPETIYRGLFAGLLGKREGRLRTGRTRRKRQRRGVVSPNKIKNMTLVHDRPATVNDRETPGDWEGDLIIGRAQRSAIGTLVDRTTRFVRLIHLPHGWKAQPMRDALVSQTADLPRALRRTLTWDQGRELVLHEEIEALSGFRIYFCDPHSPWQRGTNENINGLLRQYFPKGTDLTVHSLRNLTAVARQLNERPRMVLGDRTPSEVMQDWGIASQFP